MEGAGWGEELLPRGHRGDARVPVAQRRLLPAALAAIDGRVHPLGGNVRGNRPGGTTFKGFRQFAYKLR